MPSVVIKPDRVRDEYVIWSTVTESPHGYGSRAEVIELLRGGIRRNDAEDRANPEAAVARADVWGSSAFPEWGFGHWDDESFIYQQSGSLPRDCLWRASVLQCEERERDILDLLDPFEDDEGGAWLEERKRRAEVDAVEN